MVAPPPVRSLNICELISSNTFSIPSMHALSLTNDSRLMCSPPAAGRPHPSVRRDPRPVLDEPFPGQQEASSLVLQPLLIVEEIYHLFRLLPDVQPLVSI